MDSALLLRQQKDNNQSMTDGMTLLAQSTLIHKLTDDFKLKPLFAIWRLIGLSEIPLTMELEYTQRVVEYIEKHLATHQGFSLNGKVDNILPCYNAMLLESYSKLGLSSYQSAQNALSWIKNYQPFSRQIQSGWTGKGVNKYGGCLHNTPCYIGVAKSVKALVYYNLATADSDKRAVALAKQGMEYLLQHNLYQRLRDQKPFNHHALDIAFPASYHLNIIELVEIAYLMKCLDDKRCDSAIQYLNEQKQSSGWKNNFVYKADGYISFDGRKKHADWTSYLLNRYLSDVDIS